MKNVHKLQTAQQFNTHTQKKKKKKKKKKEQFEPQQKYRLRTVSYINFLGEGWLNPVFQALTLTLSCYSSSQHLVSCSVLVVN